ncbi:ParA family protein [Streptomyces sp. B-S-A8]|uniref:ParA family protein n=1 Tax=Streptomyces solicavernae TaxID=3043614 RepID=A0ABT6S0G1_9ACTN|nr:ParA family protein [Streptomyces sp. B-S-A8]MDI3390171.1 ParA family protein [Streptomyces sp. B-S-A8]
MWIGTGKGKGGAGCTTAALELAYAATRRRRPDGKRRTVGVLDLDPQSNATDVLEPASRRIGIKDVLAPNDPLPLREVLVPTMWPGVMVAPSSRFLANREADLTPDGIGALRRARITGELDGLVDDVIVDLPKDVGKISATGLLGLEHLFITARATLWGAQGAEEMRFTAQRIASKGNPELRIAGYIIAAYEDSDDAERVKGEMQTRFGELLLDPPVPRRSRVPEALESYHTPCREFDNELIEVADIYQQFYDRLLDDETRK